MSASPLSKFLAVTAILGASFGVGAASASAERVSYEPNANRPMSRVAWPSAFTSDSTGLYTMEQAARGEEVFIGVCYECHEVEDLNNEDFQYEWEGRSVWELYDLVRTTMPDEDPGTLSREQYLDAIAYVLKLNNQPAGPEEFSGDSVKASAFILRLGKNAAGAATPDSGAVKPDSAAMPDSSAMPDSTAKPDSSAMPDSTAKPDTMTPPDTGATAVASTHRASAAVRGLFR